MGKATFYFSTMNPVLDGMGYAVWFTRREVWSENFYLWSVIFGDVQ